ncbi:hypothetical protein [Thermocoleostomius sinensis]|uniref:Uncharacterized protein n=1 Tax=Thermocoleostomius sinensis A174 TaxID=2016057 RepID=A0A9E8ZJ37_9CYAN|nr:hypothetical protein [Thermocoleostomius sinensis]WAL59426.1 hypothetical protein OXH18_19960 [Thermocoleostomius sinensis A174]
MITSDIYNIEVKPDTRNHKGFFVRDTLYTLVGIEQSGWALICQDKTTCHYVDPDCLQEVDTALSE